MAAHLRGLDGQLQQAGGRLTVLHGDPMEVVAATASEANAVYWNDD